MLTKRSKMSELQFNYTFFEIVFGKGYFTANCGKSLWSIWTGTHHKHFTHLTDRLQAFLFQRQWLSLVVRYLKPCNFKFQSQPFKPNYCSHRWLTHIYLTMTNCPSQEAWKKYCYLHSVWSFFSLKDFQHIPHMRLL